MGADGHLTGQRCTSCGLPLLHGHPRCPDCGGRLAPATFVPTGTVWASTVVRVALRDWPDGQVLAYVDVDDGPRVLMAVGGTNLVAPDPGSRVKVQELDGPRPMAEVT